MSCLLHSKYICIHWSHDREGMHLIGGELNWKVMADLNTFKNCSNFTDEPRVIALVRGVSAAVCCVVLSIVLVALVILAALPKSRKRLCGTVIKRLTFGIIAVSVAYQLNFALHLVHYYYQVNGYCQANGFFNQYFGAVQLLFMLEISVILFFKISGKVIPSWRSLYNLGKAIKNLKEAMKDIFTCRGCKISKLEVLNLALIIVLPLVIDWIPFATNSYGLYGTWCWIAILDPDCSIHMAGLWEQIWLWNVPFGAVAFLTLVLFIASLCVLGYGVKNIKTQKLIEVGILDYVLLLAFLVFIFFLYSVEIIARSIAFSQYRFEFWLLHALSSPLSGTFIPLALLVAIQLPISSTIFGIQHKRQRRSHREGESKTINESDSSLDTPYTHWSSPHSFCDISLVDEPQEDKIDIMK